MGLDMHLTKRVYVGAEYSHRKVTGVIDINVGDEPLHVNFSKVSEIIENAGYWRKANAIHRWFVETAQEGVDDCKEYWVSLEQLKELRTTCQTVLDDHSRAQELLPTEAGFFFGGVDIDEWYFKDLEETVTTLMNLDPNGDYYYQASW